MKPFKVKVESEEHSKEIQEWLSSKGIHWCPKSHSRFVEGCKEIYYGAIDGFISSNPWDVSYFEECPFPENWFYDGKLQDSPEVTNDPRSFLMLLLGTNEDIEYKNSDGEWETFEIKEDYRIKPKPRICNGVELDECIKEPLVSGKSYYIANPVRDEYRALLFWDGGYYDFKYLDRGVAYLSEESAIKHAKAMLNLLD